MGYALTNMDGYERIFPQRTLWLIFLLGGFLAACAAPPARQVEAPADESGSASVELRASRASDPAYMLGHVTPVRLEIENAGQTPLRIAYDRFVLIDEKGAFYGALPLYRVQGTAEEPELAPGQQVLEEPAFEADQFSVAGAYSAAYPRLSTFDGPAGHDPQYHNYYFAYWAGIPLPTREMLSLGIPEGVLGPGGTLSGLLYFESTGGDLPALRLRGDFVNPFTGERLGSRSVPVE